jgi:hypothetical protein
VREDAVPVYVWGPASPLRTPPQLAASALSTTASPDSWCFASPVKYGRLRRRTVKTRSWRPSHQRFRLPDCPSREGVRRPVRPRSQYRHLLRSIDVAFDFSVSLDYSVMSQSARSLQVPPSNLQIIVQPNPHRARARFFVLHHCRIFPAIWAMIAGSRSTSVMRGRTDFHQVHRDFSV